MTEPRYLIRVAAPQEPEDAFVGRQPDGLPVWTWHQPCRLRTPSA
jgi:hypothetical protein